MSSFRPLSLLLLLLAVIGFVPAAASAQDVSVAAVDVEIAAAGDGVDAKFKVAVTNGSAAVAANVWVVFADGQEVLVGDVAAGATGTSAQVTRTLTEVVSAHQPVPVTLKYAQDGVAVDAAATLIVRVK